MQEANKNFAKQQYLGHGIVTDPGKLSTSFGTASPTRVNHQILATDFKNYAFVWDCYNVNRTLYNEKMWYFDRKPNPAYRPEKVDGLIRKHFDERYIRKTYHGHKCNRGNYLFFERCFLYFI